MGRGEIHVLAGGAAQPKHGVRAPPKPWKPELGCCPSFSAFSVPASLVSQPRALSLWLLSPRGWKDGNSTGQVGHIVSPSGAVWKVLGRCAEWPGLGQVGVWGSACESVLASSWP